MESQQLQPPSDRESAMAPLQRVSVTRLMPWIKLLPISKGLMNSSTLSTPQYIQLCPRWQWAPQLSTQPWSPSPSSPSSPPSWWQYVLGTNAGICSTWLASSWSSLGLCACCWLQCCQRSFHSSTGAVTSDWLRLAANRASTAQSGLQSQLKPVNS